MRRCETGSAAANHWPDTPPRLVGVEPETAACALESIRAGEPVTVAGPHESIMAGLNAGTGSQLSWPVLRDRQTYGRSGFPFDSPYTTRPFDYAPGLCPDFEAAREHLLLLPVDEQFTDADADDIARAVRKVFGHFSGTGPALT